MMMIGDLILDGMFCKLSDEAVCLREDTMTLLNLVGLQLHAGPKVLSKLRPERLWSLKRMRAVHFYFCAVKDAKPRLIVRVWMDSVLYWADAVTGTLYDEGGKCQSSGSLRLVGEQTRASKARAKAYFNALSPLMDNDDE